MFYQFTITIGASARTPEEAWEEATLALYDDSDNNMPDDYKAEKDSEL